MSWFFGGSQARSAATTTVEWYQLVPPTAGVAVSRCEEPPYRACTWQGDRWLESDEDFHHRTRMGNWDRLVSIGVGHPWPVCSDNAHVDGASLCRVRAATTPQLLDQYDPQGAPHDSTAELCATSPA